MLAKANSTPTTMKRALAHTITALTIAAEVDLDRTDDDRAFFAAKGAALEKIFNRLMEAMVALESYILKDGLQHQLRVELGDTVLDRAISRSKAWMKLSLRDSSPESANYVFGNDLTKLVDADIKSEPYLVLEALQRLATVSDFDGKNDIAADLEKRANQQIANLQARDLSRLKRSELSTKVATLVVEAANSLYQLNHELLMKFPRERDYVGEFFLDVAARKRKDDEETPAEQTS